MKTSTPVPSTPDPADPVAAVGVGEFIEFIERGTAALTPREVHRLVAELPDIREKIPTLDEAGFNHARGQLSFLADALEAFALGLEHELPYRAALEGAFALLYFHRDIDLIPDSLGPLGYVDDAAVVSTVLLRNAPAFAALARRRRLNWLALGIKEEGA